MSDIYGNGWGDSHDWKRGSTNEAGSWGTKATHYRCVNCKELFSHYYDNIPDIFQALEQRSVSEQCPAQPKTGADIELRKALIELVDYARFEQEWAALQIDKKHGSKKHRDNCGVCLKLDTLNNQFADSALSLINTYVNEALINELELLEKQEVYQLNGRDIIAASRARVVPKKYVKDRISELKSLTNKGNE